ncbi:hypothetical protein FNO01nite_13010 [Flavobacterium noncentrifugens]|uniref:Teneurin-like YD-shell domain-containing protein n=1 Tax=Flavobacterium noncentrifugens TaxID=1128970 RepID=A0A1G8VS60_9FLAO|nr:hypothetical protein [Flavobacterium noncentrifugens]GEP50629.1 hypothetical protein FNO01nite_13010 [Flavobacterium noncentrifugens]SDJ68834.1 hypothetical protein SAMN04487935_1498 [Flavobacterium noncentrifugens]
MKTFKTISRILTIITFSLLVFSCSDDDSEAPAVPVATVPFVTKITMTGTDVSANRVYTLEYDSNKRVSQMVCTGDISKAYLFTYNEQGKMIGLVTTGTDAATFSMTYDSTGKLTGISKNGTPGPVTYDSGTQIYTYGDNKFSFNSANDINLYNGIFFTYDDSKSGAFANVNAHYQAFMAVADPLFMYVCSKKPVSGLNYTGLDYTLTNTYDDAGYAKTFKLRDNNNAAAFFDVTYDYTNK